MPNAGLRQASFAQPLGRRLNRRAVNSASLAGSRQLLQQARN